MLPKSNSCDDVWNENWATLKKMYGWQGFVETDWTQHSAEFK